MRKSNKVLWGMFGGIFAVLLIAIILLRMSACATLPWFNGKKIMGNGNIVTINKSMPKFNAVIIKVPGKVIVKKGDRFHITLQNDSNLMPYIKTYVADGVLHIKSKPYVSLSSTGTPLFTITARSLRSFASAGANKVTITSFDPKQFSFSLSGAGKADLIGKTENLHLTISGLGKIFARNIITQNTTVNISGLGKVYLRGKGENLRVNVTGGGKIIAKKFKVNNARVHISGTADLTLYVINKLDAVISGAGSIRYYGNPTKITKRISGAGKVESMRPSKK